MGGRSSGASGCSWSRCLGGVLALRASPSCAPARADHGLRRRRADQRRGLRARRGGFERRRRRRASAGPRRRPRWVFFAGDARDRPAGRRRAKRWTAGRRAASGLAIVLGIVLDGIPESIVLGLRCSTAAASAPASWPRSSSPTCPRRSPPLSGCAGGGWTRARCSGCGSRSRSLAAWPARRLRATAPAHVAFVMAFAAGASPMLADRDAREVEDDLAAGDLRGRRDGVRHGSPCDQPAAIRFVSSCARLVVAYGDRRGPPASGR